jgi:hypothetical protein
MYALVALGYQRFYGSFGITPSDVGITQSDIIAQAAAALVLVGLVTFIVWLLLYGITVLLFKRPQLKSRKGIGATFLCLLIGPAALVLIFPVLRSWPGACLAVCGMAFIAILTILVTHQGRLWPPKALRKLGWFLTVALPILFLFSIAFTIFRAGYLSTLVSEGYPLPPGYTLLFDIRADPVCIKDLPHSPSSSSRLMYYFGRSGDLLVLFDPKLGKTIMRPAAGITLAFVPFEEFDGTCSKF